jgi:2-polyprenyl-3-methyl-5-hydroxy-6-metoxy-1,4-benzoquinol methylase
MSKIYPLMEWTDERVARFWDWQSQFPENYFTYQFGATIVASLKDYLKGRKRVLDYGCGVGYLLPHLCRQVGEVYGADPSAESVARTNERFGDLANFKGAFPVEALRARRLRFDAILCIEVIEHLSDDILGTVLGDVQNLLAPNGLAIFSTPNDEDLSKNLLFCPATGEVFHRWQHVRSWNRNSLPAHLRLNGYDVVDVVETNMSVSRTRSLKSLAKRAIKRALFGAPGNPHLVCVVKQAVQQA